MADLVGLAFDEPAPLSRSSSLALSTARGADRPRKTRRSPDVMTGQDADPTGRPAGRCGAP